MDMNDYEILQEPNYGGKMKDDEVQLQRDTRQSEIYINPILDGIKRTLSQR
jgi:hypothetical protein